VVEPETYLRLIRRHRLETGVIADLQAVSEWAVLNKLLPVGDHAGRMARALLGTRRVSTRSQAVHGWKRRHHSSGGRHGR
jgi:hypothetical protein